MTLQELLAQVLGGSSEPVRLADGPPSYRTRGNLPMPQAPSWVRGMPDRARVVPHFRPFTEAEAASGEMAVPFQQRMTTNTRLLPPEHPGNYQTFADWERMSLARPLAPDVLIADNEVWRDPQTGGPPNQTRFGGPGALQAPRALGADRPRVAIRGGSPMMQEYTAAQMRGRLAPSGALVSPEDRARARAEEMDLIYREQLQEAAQRRRGLFGRRSDR